MNDFPWLTLLVAVPLLGAVATAFLPRTDPRLAKLVGVGVALVTLAIAVAIALQYQLDGGMQLTETYSWIEAFGVHYALGVDGLGLLLILLTVLLVPIVLVGAWHDGDEDARSFVAWTLALEGLSLAVFAATDVFLFYVVFEATLIPAYFLVGGFGRPGRSSAAIKFLMFQLGGGLVMLGSVIGLYVVSAQAGTPTYLLDELRQVEMSTAAERWLFVGFFIAFAVKAPLFPLHTWLADTTEKATPGTSILLVCVLDKIGTFGMLRFCLGLFPDASRWATPVVVVLALISIVYGALVAIGQDDVLRLIGLTSLSHFGFITLGIFVMSSQGVSGSILYMVNHGLGTAALFLAAGYIIRRRGTASIRAMGGLEKVTPVLAGLLLVGGLATLSLPGLSTFVSEYLVILAAFDYRWYVGAVAVTGIVLAAIYVLSMYQRIMTGPGLPGDGTHADGSHTGGSHAVGSHAADRAAYAGHTEPHTTEPHTVGSTAHGEGGAGTGGAHPVGGGTATATRVGATAATVATRDASPREIAAIAPLLVALVLFGFYPKPLFEVANPTADSLLSFVGVSDDAPTVQGGETEEGH